MSKEYRVKVNFEEGFVLTVKADSKEQARKKVFDMVDEHGECIIGFEVTDKEVVHRDWTVDVEEIEEGKTWVTEEELRQLCLKETEQFVKESTNKKEVSDE
tara:strand:+ start:183 stop:485 length:303 start_codon:yes stop_codon:yes gene_type:complete